MEKNSDELPDGFKGLEKNSEGFQKFSGRLEKILEASRIFPNAFRTVRKP